MWKTTSDISKGLSTLDTQCALNRIESGLSAFTLNGHSPNSDPIRINPSPLPEVVWIQIELDCAIAHKDQKGHGMHACVDYRQWARFSGQHTVFHVSAQLEKQYGWLAKVRIWWGRHGSCVEVWQLEVNMHAWIRFCTTQCGRDRCALDSHWIRIGFALNSHWAIRLLNQFEFRFSVDVPSVAFTESELLLYANSWARSASFVPAFMQWWCDFNDLCYDECDFKIVIWSHCCTVAILNPDYADTPINSTKHVSRTHTQNLNCVNFIM